MICVLSYVIVNKVTADQKMFILPIHKQDIEKVMVLIPLPVTVVKKAKHSLLFGTLTNIAFDP